MYQNGVGMKGAHGVIFNQGHTFSGKAMPRFWGLSNYSLHWFSRFLGQTPMLVAVSNICWTEFHMALRRNFHCSMDEDVCIAMHWKQSWLHIQNGEMTQMLARCWEKNMFMLESQGNGVNTLYPCVKIPLQYCQSQWNLRLCQVYALVTFMGLLWFCFG